MAFTYKLPRLNADKGFAVDTPVAGTTEDLTQGELTLLDEANETAIQVLISDITGWKYDAYNAGTAQVQTVDFTTATLIADNTYSLTVFVPYVVNFFGGGGGATAGTRESRAVYTTRTYTVSTDATPTANELSTAFEARILADTYACFSAANAAGVLTITAASAEGGEMEISTTAPGATIAVTTPWVSPVGTVAEVQQETGDTVLGGTTYNRYVIEYREYLRNANVKGLQAVKPAKLVYYLDSADAGTAATVTAITAILDGSHATVADFLGAPNF
jgi:hypothetical protein